MPKANQDLGLFFGVMILTITHTYIANLSYFCESLAVGYIFIRGYPESSSFSSTIITIIRGKRGMKSDNYHNFFSMATCACL